MSPKPTDEDATRADELEALAAELGFFGAMSGERRRRVAAALGEAAALERERTAIRRDRELLGNALANYQDSLGAAHEEMKRFAGALEKTLDETYGVNRSTLASNEAAAQRQIEARDLLERLAADERRLLEGHAEVKRLQEQTLGHHALLAERSDRLDQERHDIAAREQAVAKDEGAAAAERDVLARRRDEANALAASQQQEKQRLDDLHDRLERDQAAVHAMQERLEKLIADAHEHERKMDGHQTRLEERLVAQDGRQSKQDERESALVAKQLDVETRIHHLRDLEERNERLLQVQAHQEEEKIHLNTELSKVRRNQEITNDTWEELKQTLRRLEQLETRIQSTNEVVEDLRRRTEAREREIDETLKRERLSLARRAREIDAWRVGAEARERKVQERYNEMEDLERRKLDVRRQIEKLEADQTQRVAEWERERQRQASLWAERRAEAEKARELYERNVEMVDRRIDAVARREEEHEKRAAELAKRETQLADRERIIAARDEQIAHLSRQRDTLNSIIASLTTQLGRDWTSPEAIAGGGLGAPSFDVLQPLEGTVGMTVPNLGGLSDPGSGTGSASRIGTGLGTGDGRAPLSDAPNRRAVTDAPGGTGTGTGSASGSGVGAAAPGRDYRAGGPSTT